MKGGHIRIDDMPQILEALSKIKNREINEEIYDMIQKLENHEKKVVFEEYNLHNIDIV